MNSIVENYCRLKSSIPQLLEKSGLRDNFVAEKVGINQANFSLKKQRGNWKENEIDKIIEVVLNPSTDAEDFLLGLQMQSLENEETISFQEHRRDASKWK